MILETDVPLPGKVFDRGGELVALPIRVLIAGGPVVHIHVNDLPAVEHDLDQIVLASDLALIPLARCTNGIFRRRQAVIDRAGRALIANARPAIGIGDLDFHACVDGIIEIGRSDEDAAIGPIRHLVFQFQNEVVILFLGPKIVEVMLLAIHFTVDRQHAVIDDPGVVRPGSLHPMVRDVLFLATEQSDSTAGGIELHSVKRSDPDVAKLDETRGRTICPGPLVEPAMMLQGDRSSFRYPGKLRVFDDNLTIEHHRSAVADHGDVHGIPLSDGVLEG